jgi:serine/threonine protein kinase
VAGSGGMGTVSCALRADGTCEKTITVKVVRRGLDGADAIRCFRRGRQALARFDHPNIARPLDGSVTEDDQPYFVMDYVEGLPIM